MQRLDAAAIAELEPDWQGRFATGLFYAGEAHVAPAEAMHFLLQEARRAGVEIVFGCEWTSNAAEAVTSSSIAAAWARAASCRPARRAGRAARAAHARDRLQRPVRLLHPRQPIYVVPWGDGLFMLGATVIESEDAGPVTVRSALELLGTAYALHPAFAEAEIVEIGAGVRPAFADNVPKIVVRGSTIHVNGLYRHGFLLAPGWPSWLRTTSRPATSTTACSGWKQRELQRRRSLSGKAALPFVGDAAIMGPSTVRRGARAARIGRP